MSLRHVVSVPVLFSVVASVALTGCGTNFTPVRTTAQEATYIYTLEENYPATGSVLRFSAGANGTIAPLSTITLPDNFFANVVATDPSGLIYVAGLDTTSSYAQILVYPASASGTATPQAKMTVVQLCNFMTVTSSTISCLGLFSGIYEFPTNTSGTVAPTRVIEGFQTLLDSQINTGFARDANGNLFVVVTNLTATGGQIVEFGPSASGNVAPTRTIPFTGYAEGLAVDKSQNLYLALTTYGAGTGFSAPGSIAVYNSGGQLTTTTPVTGTTPSAPGGMQIDAAGNLYVMVATGASAPYTFFIDVLPTPLTNTTLPTAKISSTSFVTPGSNLAIW